MRHDGPAVLEVLVAEVGLVEQTAVSLLYDSVLVGEMVYVGLNHPPHYSLLRGYCSNPIISTLGYKHVLGWLYKSTQGSLR